MRDIATLAAAVKGAEQRDGALVIQPQTAVAALEALKKLGGFILFDITCVDRPATEGSPAAFELSWRLLDLKEGSKDLLAVKAFLDHDRPEVPSVTGVWMAADVLEREVWDLMGIRFTGRDRLERILNAEDFVGHPLRKDFVAPKRERFPEASWGRKAAEGGQ